MEELERICAEIARWVREQDVGPGAVADLPLPARWAALSQDGRVQAARTDDDRVCILLKRHVGWKENFEGVMYCDGPLKPGEMVPPPQGPAYLSLPGLGIFEELYIRASHGPHLFEVYFDLH